MCIGMTCLAKQRLFLRDRYNYKKVFPIFFLHMFKNIILTGAMIYPFSDTYSIVVVPVEIVMDKHIHELTKIILRSKITVLRNSVI